MAGKKGKSKGKCESRDAQIWGRSIASNVASLPCDVGKSIPEMELGSNLKMVVGKSGNLKGGEGGSSICRDEDLLLLWSGSGGKPFKAAVPKPANYPARKVFEERSERIPGSGDEQAAELRPSMPVPKSLDSGPMPSYADILRNIKEHESNPNCLTSTAASSKAFGSRKTNSKRSFYDDASSIAFGQILEVDGHKHVSFSAKELEELVAPFEFSLVGKFSHGIPMMKTLKSIMGNLNLNGTFSVSLLEHKHVLIRLSCEEDYTRIWCRQVWYMAGFPMQVFKWTPDFTPQVEAPFAPVWVQFPYLPVHLFDRRSLFIIASMIGKPLRIDSATAELTRASTPRVCIEIDLTKTHLPEVEIRLDGKEMFQVVEYENIPSYCTLCKHLGHALKDCKSPLKQNAMAAAGTSKVLHGKDVDGPQQQPIDEGRLPSLTFVVPTSPCVLKTNVSSKVSPELLNQRSDLTLLPKGNILEPMPSATVNADPQGPVQATAKDKLHTCSEPKLGHFCSYNSVTSGCNIVTLDFLESSKSRELISPQLIDPKNNDEQPSSVMEGRLEDVSQSWPSSPRSYPYDPDEVAICLDKDGQLHLIDHQTLELSYSPHRGSIDDLSEDYPIIKDRKKGKDKQLAQLTRLSKES